jgi:hypothetical protein
MKIAVLGWGSLIWDSRELELPKTSWHEDGPLLPIEFARKSGHGRLTLVIYPSANTIPVLWARMHQTEISTAKETLRKREGINHQNIGYYYEYRIHTRFPEITEAIQEWIKKHRFDALVWTDLKSNFDVYNEEKVFDYLSTEANKEACREYIEKAPEQIETDMRRKIINSGILQI